LNHHEYGFPSGVLVKPIDIHFQPSEYGILNDYSVVKEIYRVQLSPTIITLTTHKETNLVSHIEIAYICGIMAADTRFLDIFSLALLSSLS